MDISAFRERSQPEILSVSGLNSLIKGMFDSNRLLSAITIRGEISNFKAHSSGHLYLSLKDDASQIRAVMFRGAAASLRFAPENGMRVIVSGSVSVYAKDGSYQLYVGSMQPDGIGDLHLAYEQLKAKLEAEGLFSAEAKKPIPPYPNAIGVITSPTGAAVRDIINVISRRSPGVQIYLYPALVQGDGAEDSIIRGLDYFDSTCCVDTVIIGRGGGSIEDLWAFNGERLARRIFLSRIPIISAVGHQTDFTIADFVADMRAPTPSAAAELAVPDVRELLMRIAAHAERCDSALVRLCERYRERFDSLREAEIYADPTEILKAYSDRLQEARDNIGRSIGLFVDMKKAGFSASVGKLEALSPLAVLSRGYAVVKSGAAPLTDSQNVEIGQKINVTLSKGKLIAEVTERS